MKKYIHIMNYVIKYFYSLDNLNNYQKIKNSQNFKFEKINKNINYILDDNIDINNKLNFLIDIFNSSVNKMTIYYKIKNQGDEIKIF